MTDVLTRGWPCEDTQGEHHMMTKADRSDAFISQGTPKITRKPPEARKKEGFPIGYRGSIAL